jgi:chloramphenicol 3-O phosphotransferase
VTGRIILLNGASSSGKSTLARSLQARLDEAFWHFSIDHLNTANVLPEARIRSGEFAWNALRESFFEGFHRCIPALAEAGNNLVVEHIVETAAWRDRLLRLLARFDVYFVGVHCPLPELERRERERGDRRAGEARADFETTHALCTYDFEVDATAVPERNVDAVIAAWRKRRRPGAFDRMAETVMMAPNSGP